MGVIKALRSLWFRADQGRGCICLFSKSYCWWSFGDEVKNMEAQRCRDPSLSKSRLRHRPGSDSACGCSKPSFLQLSNTKRYHLRFIVWSKQSVSCKVSSVVPITEHICRNLWECRVTGVRVGGAASL